MHTSVEELAHGYNCHDSLAFFYLSFGFPNVRCFIPHPSNEGPANTLFPRTTSAAGPPHP
nr:hypothetical protein HMPREF0276_1981 [Corynebacterium accolens ATCC 49725]